MAVPRICHACSVCIVWVHPSLLLLAKRDGRGRGLSCICVNDIFNQCVKFGIDVLNQSVNFQFEITLTCYAYWSPFRTHNSNTKCADSFLLTTSCSALLPTPYIQQDRKLQSASLTQFLLFTCTDIGIL